MDDRTYNAPQGGLRYYVAITQDELARLRAEVKRLESELTLRLRQLMRANAEDRLWLMKTERLTHDLADAQTVANLQRELHAAELATANDNAAELGKALDMCIAERDSAFAEVDAQTLKANSFRRELHRYMQHAIELKDMLDASVAERDSAFAELDKHRRELTALRDERPRLLAANVRLFHDNNKLRRMSSLWKRTAKHYKRLRINDDRFRLLAESTFAKENEQLRAELDAMRQAHSVVAARMAAMGC